MRTVERIAGESVAAAALECPATAKTELATRIENMI